MRKLTLVFSILAAVSTLMQLMITFKSGYVAHVWDLRMALGFLTAAFFFIAADTLLKMRLKSA